MMEPGFDIRKLYSEAQNRWLKPSEVLFILQNHEKCVITPEPPNRPSSGSVFLFNRRVLRFFRNDGHVWRRKRDGRTVGEAHERLKVGNVDKLNCYYAHGEQNPYFQRRSYWMLDPAYDHIVLVHYREVSEGRCIPGSVSSLSSISSVTCNQSTNHANTKNQGTNDFSSYSSVSAEEVSSKSILGNINRDFEAYDRMANSAKSSRPCVNQALRMLELQLSLDDDDVGGDKLVLGEEKLPPNSAQEISQSSSHIDYECGKPALDLYGNILHRSEYTEHYYFDKDIGGCDNSDTSIFRQGNCWKQLSQLSGSECMAERKSSISWKEMLEKTSSSSTGVATQSTLKTFTSESAPDSSAGTTCAIENDFPAKDMRVHGNDMCLSTFETGNLSINSCGSSEKLISQQTAYTENSWDNTYQDPESSSQIHLSAARKFLLGSDYTIELPTTAKQFQQTEDAIQYKAEGNICQDNSVGNVHWMQNMHSTGDRTICFSHCSDIPFKQRQLLAPLGADSSVTVAQKSLFSIREISPEWAFSSGNTKVVVTGDFFCNHSGYDWKVMFDDIEVPAQIIQEGVLRCQAPQHVAGRVSICVTYGNRVPCSEVREFEYRVKPDLSCLERGQQKPSAKTIDELLLLIKFGQILLCGHDATSIQNGENGPQTDPFSKLKATGDQWGHIIESLSVGSVDSPDAIDWLLQELFKDKLKQWSSSRSQDYGSRGCSLSKREQSLIHLISALGYDWALSPILSVGVGVNFRDLNGWTALHWAAHFGREKMVAALLAAGASAGAVTDPTTQDLVGKNPASVAAASGHKGLAGYLSEVALTSHLTSLTMEGSEVSKGSADLTAERAVESIYEKSIQVHEGATEDQLSLKDSLAAVRNAAQAAARIQSAFRAHSFRKKRLNAAPSHDDYYLTPQDIHNLSVASKFFHGHRDQKFHIAALCIQRKYRGWRGRKNFLTLRQNVVKIQAHVRGHQVRKKYREFVWTVGVVEKVILRWRRRGAGLRGFKAESEPIDDIEADDILKVFRKQKVDAALDEAVSRVLSVVESPEARQQYRRMLESYQLAKAELESAGEATSSARGDHDSGGTNQDMFDCTLDETWAHLNSSDVDDDALRFALY